MTGKQLKNSILQWAIQGKLVPQDPNDEPASVLLEKIRAEKARLVKEGKIKKDKNESIIYRSDDNSYYEKMLATGEQRCIDDELPYTLPSGWEWCRMGSIGEWGAGATPAKGNLEYYNGNVLWLRTGELNNDVVYDTEIKVTKKALKECSLRLNKVGDVMIAMYGATIGKVAIVGKEMTTNQACCACTPIGVFNWYLFYFLMSSQIDFIKKGEGGAQPNISREKLIAHLMPVPPVDEQHRIVLKIKEILPYVDRYAQSQATQNLLNEEIKFKLRKSILQEAIQGKLVPQDPNDEPVFVLLKRIRAEKEKLIAEGKLRKKDIIEFTIFRGDDSRYYEQIGKKITEITNEIPFDIPSSWGWIRGKEAFLPMESTKPVGTDFIYVDVDAVNNKRNIIEKVKILSTSNAPSRATRRMHTGDVLFSMVRPYLRKIALVEKKYSNAIASTGFYVITPTCAFYSPYLFYLMLSSYVVDGLNQYMKGENSPSINNGHIEKFLYPLPPIDEQKRIVIKIEELYAHL